MWLAIVQLNIVTTVSKLNSLLPGRSRGEPTLHNASLSGLEDYCAMVLETTPRGHQGPELADSPRSRSPENRPQAGNSVESISPPFGWRRRAITYDLWRT